MHSRHSLLIALLLLLCLAGFVISLLSGSVSISLTQMKAALIDGVPGVEHQILWELRIPRTLAAFVTGGLLALSGVIMQVLLRNPLADPYILGVSGGAAVGALLTIMLGLGSAALGPAAFAGAMLSILIVFGLAGHKGRWSPTRLLLTGVVIAAGWGAVINIMLTTSDDGTIYSMLFWLMGDLAQSRVGLLHFLLLLGGTLAMFVLARALNALARGELLAASLGVNISALKLTLYFAASLLTATAVTIAGAVGFVGLVVPHMLRLLGARDHRVLIPGSVLLGGCFLMVADSLARTILAPQQLPVGVLTALIGVPVFLLILHHSHRSGSGQSSSSQSSSHSGGGYGS